MTKVNSGLDLQSRCVLGDVAGYTGTSTGTSASSLTDTGATWTTNAFANHIVVAAGVYGVILSNTGTALTLDRWYSPASPGGAAGSTPGATSQYVILPGGSPAWYMALTANSAAVNATDTTLTGEITTASGGLIKKLCPYAHTLGTTTSTLTPVFTANGNDALPVTIAKVATFNSIVASTGAMWTETLLGTTATLSASGDQLTVTETITLS